MHAILVMDNIMDFLQTAVENRWCIEEEGFMPASGCDLTHSGSIERLIMSEQTHRIIEEMIGAGKTVQGLEESHLDEESRKLIVKDCIEKEEGKPIKLNIDNLVNHPLEVILEHYENSNNLERTSFEYRICRDKTLSDQKAKIFLKIKIGLTSYIRDSSSSNSFSMESLLGIVPRELGTFGLIVAHDLHLDKKCGEQSYPKSTCIGAFSNWDKGKEGLKFKSPVFVNGNVYLPKKELENQRYSPVTFEGLFVLGGGNIQQGEGVYAPRLPNSVTDAPMWNDNPYFGGFLAGIKLDRERDLGLDYFSYNEKEAIEELKASYEGMKSCIDLFEEEINLDRTKNSQLRIKNLETETNKYEFQLTDENRFIPQTKLIGGKDEEDGKDYDGDFSSYKVKRATSDTDDKSGTEGEKKGKIVQLNFKMKELEVESRLSETGVMTLLFEHNTTYVNKKRNYERDKDAIGDSISSLNSEISSLRAAIEEKRRRGEAHSSLSNDVQSKRAR